MQRKQLFLYWYNDDRVLIEGLSLGPVRAIIDEKIKSEMLSVTSPFKIAFLVDIEIDIIDRETVCKVIKVHTKY